MAFTHRKYVNVGGSHGAECVVFGWCAEQTEKGRKGAALVSPCWPAKLLTEPSLTEIGREGQKTERSCKLCREGGRGSG